MSIDADRFAGQVKLAYEFMEALHGQALALIKDVETQLGEAPEELQCLRPGGYRFTVNRQSMSLERPQATIATYYAVCFRHFADRSRTTPFAAGVPPVLFLKIVLRERGLEQPEVRFGVFSEVAKAPGRGERQSPTKFEDRVSTLADQALTGPPWSAYGMVKTPYADSYVTLVIQGAGVRVADIPDSEAVASRIVDPLLAMYREARQSG